MRVYICMYGCVCVWRGAHLAVRCMKLPMYVHMAHVHVQLVGCIMLVTELCSWKEQVGTLGAAQCRGTVLSFMSSELEKLGCGTWVRLGLGLLVR